MKLRVLFVCAITFSTFTRLAIAQTVFVVAPAAGAGVFSTQIQPAIDAATDGDVILVKSGFFQGFTIVGKSVSVVADLGARVNVTGDVFVAGLASSERVLIQGVTVAATGAPSNLRLSNDAGPVWIEDCACTPSTGCPWSSIVNGADVVQCVSVSFLRCSLHGHGLSSCGYFFIDASVGLATSRSTVTLYDGFCFGGDGGTINFGDPCGTDGGAGASMGGGFAFASSTVFQGGDGGPGSFLCYSSSGGDGLIANASFVSLGNTFLGGIGGDSGVDGNPLSGTITALPGTPRHFEATSPVRELQSSTFTCGGTPGEMVAVLFAFDQNAAVYMPQLSGALLPSLVGADALLLGTIPGNSVLTVQKRMPSLPLTAQGLPIYLQGIFVDSATANVVLGPASAVVVLDSSL